MKTLYTKTALLWILGFIFASPLPVWSAPEKITKKVEKLYPISSDGRLEIDNQYGNINLVPWDRNEVSIEVSITVEGRNAKDIEKRLEKIDLAFESEPDRVRVETLIGEFKSSWFSISINFNPKERLKFRVDYLVKAPPSLHLDLKNKFGNIALEHTYAPAKIHCEFGQIQLGELHGSGHDIRIEFSKNSSIDFMEKGKIRAEYSSLDINRAHDLDWGSDFSKLELEKVDELIYTADYGRLAVGKVDRIEGSSDFANIRIGNLNQTGDLSADFGSIHIRKLAAPMQSCRLETEFTRIRLGIAPESSFSFRIDLEHASLDTDLNLDYQKKIQDHSERFFSGTFGASPLGKLTIEAEHGNVKLIPSTQF